MRKMKPPRRSAIALALISGFALVKSVFYPAAMAGRDAEQPLSEGERHGEREPLGSLPFDLPGSMDAVIASRSDVPFDTAEPTFRFGHALRY